jgi:signal transduction histidine kinase
VLVIVDNFLLPGNQVFSEITVLEPHEMPWGESYAVPDGHLNPLKWLGDIPSILFLVFVVDATVRLYPRGNRQRAWAVGGVIVVFILLAGVHTPLVDVGLIKTPYLIGFFFLAIVVGLTNELVRDIARASRTANELRRVQSELEHLGRVTLLGELTAALAHELNQPLAAILANAQAGSLFLEQAEPDLGEIADILQEIASEDERAREIILRLRAMLEKGEQVRESTDLNHEVEETVMLLGHELESNAVALDLELGDRLPPVRADRLGIRQVLVNLLLNAEQAAAAGRDGEGKVLVRTRVADDSATVEVSDNGSGIDPEALATIFEPFYTTKLSGIGMGLSICRTIIENHRGKIRAENRDGGGAKFTISIPLENEEPAE